MFFSDFISDSYISYAVTLASCMFEMFLLKCCFFASEACVSCLVVVSLVCCDVCFFESLLLLCIDFPSLSVVIMVILFGTYVVCQCVSQHPATVCLITNQALQGFYSPTLLLPLVSN